MKAHNYILFSVLLLTLTSCASVPNSLNSESRKNIKTIYVKILPIDHDPGIYTSDQEIAGLTAFMFSGTQASLNAQNEAAKHPFKMFGNYLKRNNINVDKIVKAELEKQLKKTRLFRISSKKNADAIISVRIGTYGFAQKGLWSSYQRSQIYLYADLNNNKKDKKLIAKFLGYASPFRDEKAMTIKEIYKNPKSVRKSFEKSTVVAVKDIIEKMSEK